MALDKYEGPGSVILDNSLLAEAQSVRWNYNGNNRPVKTMRKDLAGRSKGAGETRVSVTNAIPRAGLEQEFAEKCIANADATVVVVLAGKRYQVDGWIDDFDVSQGVDEAAVFSFNIMGGPPRILRRSGA